MQYYIYNSENVVLSYIIKSKIKIDNQIQGESPKCKFCEFYATKYCDVC